MKRIIFISLATCLIIGMVYFSGCPLNTPGKELISYDNQVETQQGLLIFESWETFDAVSKRLKSMSSEETKKWEEAHGFKSYARLMEEILAIQIEVSEKYEKLSEEEKDRLIESGCSDGYADIIKEYLQKGIVRFIADEAGEQHLDFKNLVHPELINEEGLVVIGDSIIQFTESLCKVIKSRDFNKIPALKQLNAPIDNDSFYVTEIRKTANIRGIYQPPWCDVPRISNTIDKKKIVIFEFFSIYDTWGGPDKRAYYRVMCRAEKKDFWGDWVWENTRIWFDGNGQVQLGTVKVPFSFDFNDEAAAVIKLEVVNGLYPQNMEISIPKSTITAIRWGGPSGIGVRVIDHAIVQHYPFPTSPPTPDPACAALPYSKAVTQVSSLMTITLHQSDAETYFSEIENGLKQFYFTDQCYKGNLKSISYSIPGSPSFDGEYLTFRLTITYKGTVYKK